MTQHELRKLILRALCSDDWLFDHLVLKGGNALALAYQIGERTSLDLDFSIEDDFQNTHEVADRIESALKKTLADAGVVVFDFQLTSRPRVTDTFWWGGYEAQFKLIAKTTADKIGFRTSDMRRQALAVNPATQRRKFSIEISKYEYVGDVVRKDIDGFPIRVYSPVLLAAEKLRALLQQHPDYRQIPPHSKRSRSRDLCDIWAISDYFSVRLEAHLPTIQSVFEAKHVDMRLLARLSELRALHYASWPDVEISVSRRLEDFDIYFDFAVHAANELYSRWIEDSP